MAETINSLFKAEVIWKRSPWKTMDEEDFAAMDLGDWFNNRRLLEPIEDIPVVWLFTHSSTTSIITMV